MLTQPCEKHLDRGARMYVIDVCIPIAYNFLLQGKEEESRSVTMAGISGRKGKTAIAVR